MAISHPTMLLIDVVVAAVGFAGVFQVTAAKPLSVALDHAKVIGVASGSVQKFLGIPFAQPP